MTQDNHRQLGSASSCCGTKVPNGLLWQIVLFLDQHGTELLDGSWLVLPYWNFRCRSFQRCDRVQVRRAGWPFQTLARVPRCYLDETSPLISAIPYPRSQCNTRTFWWRGLASTAFWSSQHGLRPTHIVSIDTILGNRDVTRMEPWLDCRSGTLHFQSILKVTCGWVAVAKRLHRAWISRNLSSVLEDAISLPLQCRLIGVPNWRQLTQALVTTYGAHQRLPLATSPYSTPSCFT